MSLWEDGRMGRQEEDGKGGTNTWSSFLISVKVMARGQ